MCGILSILNYDPSDSSVDLQGAVEAGKARGPEQTDSQTCNGVHHVFHRLAINGLDPESMMPLDIDECILICNGEIYNYNELCELLKITPTTKNDCEIIIHLYRKVGIERCVELLDGEFAFILQDKRVKTAADPDKIFVVRDPYGVRPLYVLNDKITGRDIIAAASELKVLHAFTENGNINQITPGTITTYKKDWRVNAKWYLEKCENYHNMISCNSSYKTISHIQADIQSYTTAIVQTLTDAVRKRVTNTDRPVACLLSGGLDSSLVAALASKLYSGRLKTYSIGFEGSEDLKMAEVVAQHIGSDHESVILTEQDFLDAIPEVIKSIESYDTTSVRASVGNYLVSKRIAEIGREKVVLNGDGSDEVTGGYLYFTAAPDDISFDAECKRLIKNIHYFDVLRSDRSVSIHGLEPRTPFLDKSFVQMYINIPPCIRNPKSDFNKNCTLWDQMWLPSDTDSNMYKMISSRPTKLLLRAAFHIHDNTLLPQSILWRTKEAFSDGVSTQTKSWYEVIQDYVAGIDFDINREIIAAGDHMTPTTKEQAWYRKIFCDEYPDRDSVVPYFWMPIWVDATDASARTLQCYNYTTTCNDEEMAIEN